MKSSNRWLLFISGWFLILLLAISACARSASTPARTLPATPEPGQNQIEIQSVRVTAGAAIEVNGAAFLPENACLKTELLENDQPVDWWPQGTCIIPDQGSWQMVVALQRDGAPADLNRQSVYVLHAWWSDRPDEIQHRFPLDLQ